MARYFMGDTRLAGLERMMMDPSRMAPVRTDAQKKLQKQPRKKPPCSRPAKLQPREWEIKGDGV